MSADLFGILCDTPFVKNAAVEARLKRMKMPLERVVRDYYLSSFVVCGDWVAKEVQTEVGRIDLLTEKYIFEFKQVKKWKEGLGQLLVYSHYYPNHKKVLYLVGSATDSYMDLVEEHCQKLGVIVLLKSIDVAELRRHLQSQAKAAIKDHFDRPVVDQQQMPTEE